jgi:hypothetical protein
MWTFPEMAAEKRILRSYRRFAGMMISCPYSGNMVDRSANPCPTCNFCIEPAGIGQNRYQGGTNESCNDGNSCRTSGDCLNLRWWKLPLGPTGVVSLATRRSVA